ncbi:hypothetical protein MRB53_028898 [Persea americana]|uniref:Uncharacterized protein n=1 Tax=Persea americana TaxID=3435 RepID=A0ACC2KHE5_PERAE|nr:hypothetical protein MRB53_028898 [Persea americana]
MHASICCLHYHHIFPFPTSSHFRLVLPLSPKTPKNPNLFPTSLPLSSPKPLLLLSKSSPNCLDGDSSETDFFSFSPDTESETATSTGVGIEVEKSGNNRRRVLSRIGVDASLDTIWNILTDYERLSEFIPGLAVCQLLEKKEKFAKLFQVGRQNLAFGLKFNAKGVLECYEKDLVHLPFGQRRDIEFKMIEGDFQTFEGKWSIVQAGAGRREEENEVSAGQEFASILWYEVDVEPKMWLPVGLVEGRLCKEIELNLTCIRDEAHRVVLEALGACQ